MSSAARYNLSKSVHNSVMRTGVAGPDPQGNTPVGRVFVAVAWESGDDVRILSLDGSREEIRTASVKAALDLLIDAARGTS